MTTPVILQSSRVPFLILGPACAFLGLAICYQRDVDFEIFRAFLVILGTICAHISVNLLNEYQDFRSGLDMNTKPTPFSGGSGALPAQPDKARQVFIAGWVVFALTALIGAYLMTSSNFKLLIVGLPGLLLVATYTPWINRSPWLCLIAPGLGFGVFVVIGTVIALGSSIDLKAVTLCLTPFALINNLLLLNQFPDLQADQQAGRRHLIIRYGLKAGLWVYGINLLLAFASIAWLIGTKQLISQAWLLMLLLIPGLFALGTASKKPQALDKTPAALAANVIVAVFSPVLLGLFVLLS